MLIVTPDTILNRGALALKQVPRRFFGRAVLWPRGGGAGLWLRTLFEVQAFRYTLPLLPFLIVGFTWRNTALALAQAPLFMLLMIAAVEMRLLRLSDRARKALMDEVEAARTRDLIAVRGRAILTRIAAGRGLGQGQGEGKGQGRLHLVIEHSPLARVAPLTYVSVQAELSGARPAILPLDPSERALITKVLFDAELPEEASRRLSLFEGEALRMITLDTSEVSAHARLRAVLEADGPVAAAVT